LSVSYRRFIINFNWFDREKERCDVPRSTQGYTIHKYPIKFIVEHQLDSIWFIVEHQLDSIFQDDFQQKGLKLIVRYGASSLPLNTNSRRVFALIWSAHNYMRRWRLVYQCQLKLMKIGSFKNQIFRHKWDLLDNWMGIILK
jgi:hypothetical protein